MSRPQAGPRGTTSEGVAGRDQLACVAAILSLEFADRLDAATIERVAAEEVAAFDEARVGDFIPILAMRRGRLRLWELAHRRGDVLGDLKEGEGESRLVARV
jgi:hypothetical protein